MARISSLNFAPDQWISRREDGKINFALPKDLHSGEWIQVGDREASWEAFAGVLSKCSGY